MARFLYSIQIVFDSRKEFRRKKNESCVCNKALIISIAPRAGPLSRRRPARGCLALVPMAAASGCSPAAALRPQDGRAKVNMALLHGFCDAIS